MILALRRVTLPMPPLAGQTKSTARHPAIRTFLDARRSLQTHRPDFGFRADQLPEPWHGLAEERIPPSPAQLTPNQFLHGIGIGRDERTQRAPTAFEHALD